MRKTFLCLFLATGFWTSPALACAGGGPDGYISGIVWENPPSDVPINAVVLRVSAVRPIAQSYGFLVEVSSDTDAAARTYRVMPYNQNSCVSLGASAGYIVVTRKAEMVPDAGGRLQGFLMAFDYEESWRNLLSRVFGFGTWTYPGARTVVGSLF